MVEKTAGWECYDYLVRKCRKGVLSTLLGRWVGGSRAVGPLGGR